MLKRVYTKFNQTCRSILKDKRKNKEYINENNHNASNQTKYEPTETEKNKPKNVVQEKSTNPKLEVKVLNQLIHELGSLLEASNSNQVSFQVQLKKESTIELTNETKYKFEDNQFENLLLKQNKRTKETANKDPHDKQLNNIIKQLEEECNKYHTKENKSQENGQMKSNRPRSHVNNVHVHKETELNNDIELPRKRTNSEVAEHKDKALNDLKMAEIEINLLK